MYVFRICFYMSFAYIAVHSKKIFGDYKDNVYLCNVFILHKLPINTNQKTL